MPRLLAPAALRRSGRTFSYIAEEIGVCRDVIGRELRARGIATGERPIHQRRLDVSFQMVASRRRRLDRRDTVF
jgi:hypothetical protein